MKFRIIIGDYSFDGHNQTEVFFVDVKRPYNMDDVSKAYQKAVKIIGIDPKNLCRNFEDNTISSSDVTTLNEYFSDLIKYFDYDLDEDGKLYVCPEFLAELICEFITLGGVGTKILKNDVPILKDSLGCGYGCFHLE